MQEYSNLVFSKVVQGYDESYKFYFAMLQDESVYEFINKALLEGKSPISKLMGSVELDRYSDLIDSEAYKNRELSLQYQNFHPKPIMQIEEFQNASAAGFLSLYPILRKELRGEVGQMLKLISGVRPQEGPKPLRQIEERSFKQGEVVYMCLLSQQCDRLLRNYLAALPEEQRQIILEAATKEKSDQKDRADSLNKNKTGKAKPFALLQARRVWNKEPSLRLTIVVRDIIRALRSNMDEFQYPPLSKKEIDTRGGKIYQDSDRSKIRERNISAWLKQADCNKCPENKFKKYGLKIPDKLDKKTGAISSKEPKIPDHLKAGTLSLEELYQKFDIIPE